MIDPAMLRPGRLDKLLYVELPTAGERHDILKKLTKKSPLIEGLSLVALANDHRCEGFSGADLASLVREAAVAALRKTFYLHSTTLSEEDKNNHKEIFITSEDFDTAFEKVSPSVSKQDKRHYDALRVKLGCPMPPTKQAKPMVESN
jgi:ribosome biogenesis ATPase